MRARTLTIAPCITLCTLLGSISGFGQGVCSNTEIFCGSIMDSNAGASAIEAYDCEAASTGWTGGERTYFIANAIDESKEITLTGLQADLDLFLFCACNPPYLLDCSTNSGTNDESLTIGGEGEFYVAVDGWNGAQSAYTLDVSCIIIDNFCGYEQNGTLPYGSRHRFADFNQDGFLDIIQYEEEDEGLLSQYLRIYFYASTQPAYSENNRVTVATGMPAIDFFITPQFEVTDLNADNLVDIVYLSGGGGGTAVSMLINQGNGVFISQVIGSSVPLLFSFRGDPVPGDVDNDGDIDIIACTDEPNCYIYYNDGDEGFREEVLDLCAPAITYVVPKYMADFDKDGYNDLVAEQVLDDEEIDMCDAVLYSNVGVACGACLSYLDLAGERVQDIGDFDNDGDLDLLTIQKCSSLATAQPSPDSSILHRSVLEQDASIQVIENLYPDPGFTINPLGAIDTALCGVCITRATWKDVSINGKLDIAVTTILDDSWIFRQSDFGLFEFLSLPDYRTIVWGDYDMDHEMDFCGVVGTDTYFASVFDCGVNTPPSAPTGLAATPGSAGEVWLSWNPAFDAQQPDTSLSYNIFLATANFDEIVASPLADEQSGKRRVVQLGAQSQDTFWHYKDLEPGTYTWQVQGIDHACAGGAWSTMQTFTIDQCLVFEEQQIDFTDNYLSFGFNDIVMADFSPNGAPQLLDLMFKGIEGIPPSIYQSVGNDTFDPLYDFNQTGEYVLGDLNNDNIPDIVLIENGSYAIYLSITGTYVLSDGFDGAYSGAAIIDLDRDGDNDIVVGSASGGDLFMFENTGDGTFGPEMLIYDDPDGGIIAVRDVIAAFDVDNDGNLDLLTSVDFAITTFGFGNLEIVYSQDGVLQTPVTIGEQYGIVAIADVDSDGDKDILNGFPGDCVECSAETNLQLYENVGNAYLAPVNIIPFPCDDYYVDLQVGDLDHDGFPDLSAIQTDVNGVNSLRVYRYNPNSGTYSQIHEVDSVDYMTLGDTDGDDDLDIVYQPLSPPCGCLKVLVNQSSGCSNTPPGPPQNVTCHADGDSIVVSWDPAADAEQSAQSLTYNIAVYAEGDPDDLIVSPLSDLTNGFRKLVRFGDQCHGTSWVIHNLEPGDYCVRVQAIDHSYAGGPWSDETCCSFCPATTSTVALEFMGFPVNEFAICRGLQSDETYDLQYTLADPDSEASYLFLITDDNGGVLDATSMTYDFSVLQPGTYYVYGVSYYQDLTYMGQHISEISGTVCDILSDNRVVIHIDPMPQITFLPDLRICPGESTQIVADVSDLTGCIWTPTIGLDDPNSCFPVASPSVTTTYTVSIFSENACSISYDVTVIVEDIPDVTVSDAMICSGGCVTLTGSGATTCAWYEGTDFGAGPIATTCNVEVCPETTTTYSLVVMGGNDCADTLQATVFVGGVPDVVVAGDSICAGESVSLFAESGAPITCQWSPATGLDDPTQCNPVANPTSTTTYMVTVTDENMCTTTGTATITVVPNPTANAGQDIMICEDVTILDLNGSGGIDCTWYDSNGEEIANACNTTVDAELSTYFSLEVRVQTGSVQCSDTDTVALTVHPLPGIAMPQDTTGCPDRPVVLQAEIDCEDCACLWEPTTGLSDAMNCNPIAQPAPGTTTTYTLTVIDNTTGCMMTDSVEVFVQPRPFDSLFNDQFVLIKGHSGTFNVMDNDSLVGAWEAVFRTDHDLPFEVVTSEDGTVQVTASGDFIGRDTFFYRLVDPLCGEMSDEDIIEIVVIMSDRVTICDPGLESVGCIILSDIENYPDNRIAIFNRYGNVVHIDRPYQNDWDGLHIETGEAVPTGSYYFVLELGEHDITGVDAGIIKGVILIVRQGG